MTEKKKKRSASKPTDPLSLVRGALGDRKSPSPIRLALEVAKNEARVGDFERVYGLAQISPMLARAFPASGPSGRANLVHSATPLETTSIYREVAWAANALGAASMRVNAYVPLRNEFCGLFMSGRYGEASLVLNRIDWGFGPSLWAVENRIALLALQGGFDNQKPYVNALLARYKKGFLAFFASNVSERNESRVTAMGYERRLRDRAKSWSISDEFRTYIHFKLLGQLPVTMTGAASLLAYESSSSTIDLFQTFITVLDQIRDLPGLKAASIKSALDGLSGIKDHCITNLRILYGMEPDARPGVERSYMSEFLRGNYQAAADAVAAALATDSTDSAAIVIACVLAMLDVRAFKTPGHVIGKAQELYARLKGPRANSADAADELEKLVRNIQQLPIAQTIAILARQSQDPRMFAIARSTALRTEVHSAQTLGPLLGVGVTSAALLAPDAERRPEHGLAEGQLSADFEYLARTGDAETGWRGRLSAEAASYALGSYFAKERQYDKALVEFASLQNSQFQFFRDESLVREAWILFESGFILDSLRLSTRIMISRPAQGRALPLTNIVGTRGFRDLKAAQAELILPIAFLRYSQLAGDSSKDVSLKVAWRQFLRSHGVDRPSELQDSVDKFDREQLVCFLSTVCVQEVMELGGAFSSPGDLDAERLKICLLLRRLDPANVLQYDAEVLELTRRLSIEEGVRQVDSSRIYVDVVGIERWCHTNLEESFLRYVDYVGAGLQSTVEELERQLIQIMKRGSKTREIEDFLDSYDVSADSILQDVIEAAALAFMTLPRYGLDAFLGSRVRHGSLEGIFRSPLERLKLITKIDSRTNEYESNDYWISALEFGDPTKRVGFGRMLSNLSKSIDAILDNAVGRYVYVRSESNQDGLITLWQSDESKRQRLLRWVIQAKVALSTQPDTTLSDFVDYCAYSIFWPALSTSLERVQSFATDELASALVRCLDAAERDAASLVPSGQLTGFVSRLRAARIEVGNSAAKLASWFHVPAEPSKGSSYLLKTAMEIGLRSTSQIWPDFSIDVAWNVEDAANVRLRTPAFETINDISYLIFGNIAKHSGFFGRGEAVHARPRVLIDLTMSERHAIEVRVTSPIDEGVSIDNIRRNVDQAKATIAGRKYEEVVSRTRGTGLVRMASTLNYEGNEDKTLDFGLTEDAHFFVRFVLPLYVLTEAAPT